MGDSVIVSTARTGIGKAGRGAFKIEPRGARMRIGASEPLLFGIRLPITQRMPNEAYACVYVSGTFMP